MVAEATQRQLQSPAHCGAAARTSQKTALPPQVPGSDRSSAPGWCPQPTRRLPSAQPAVCGLHAEPVSRWQKCGHGWIHRQQWHQGRYGWPSGRWGHHSGIWLHIGSTQRSLLADPWGAIFFLEMSVSSCGKLLGWNPESRLARWQLRSFCSLGLPWLCWPSQLTRGTHDPRVLHVSPGDRASCCDGLEPSRLQTWSVRSAPSQFPCSCRCQGCSDLV